MNWSRGLFRVWLLLSALWLIGSGVALFEDWPSMPLDAERIKWIEKANCEVQQQLRIMKDTLRGNVASERPSEEEAACLVAADKRVKGYLRWHVVGVALGVAIPPAVLFVLGWGGLWAARGFTQHRRE